jgi:hypothetical protein
VATVANVDGELYKQRAAGLADLEGPEGRVDSPPDVPEVAPRWTRPIRLSRTRTVAALCARSGASRPDTSSKKSLVRWGGWGSNPRPAD